MKVSLCIMCKDDTSALKENISYHRLIGVDHFFIYDNLSKVPIKHSLKGNDITIIEWSDINKVSQCKAYDHCIKEYKNSSDWIGFIDTDEFIVLKDNCINIKDFLKDYLNFGGVGMQWKCFGSSGIINRSTSIINNFIHASCTDDDVHIKTILQPKYVISSDGNPHAFKYKSSKYCVNENFKRIDGPYNKPITHTKIQLNHYVTRSREDFEDKRRRGGGNIRNSNKLTESFWNRFQNGKPDTTIIELVKTLKP